MKPRNICGTIVFLIVALFQPLSISGQEEFSTKIQAILDQSVTEYHLPGIVMLARNAEGETFLGASGFADLETQTPMTPQHRIRIASISKTFVATVILQLVEEGALSLDETMDRWLDASLVDAIPNGHDVTLRQLLSHTSGIYDFEDSAFIELLFADMQKPWTPLELIQHALDHGEPYFEPGQGYQYSNTNYILLGLIIEKVTSSTMEEQIRTRILSPLHLHQTFSGEEDYPLDEWNAASYMVQEDGSRMKIVDLPLNFEWGHGHMISTVEDLAVFFQSLVDGRLFQNRSTLDAMLTMTPESDYKYGLGIIHGSLGYGHTGGTFAFASCATYRPEDGMTLVFAVNDLNLYYEDSEIEWGYVWATRQLHSLLLPSAVEMWCELK
ncbi:MAG: class A beta-lactamase-related serine hydrolase [Candidatus Omnitrophota bacterium]|jgi:D-alanyl-D-alanine carboxypeptidase|nr:MAG: class A beta-lactamase-related serine hydrolase [Candidatus Omnitrophota bacterium]